MFFNDLDHLQDVLHEVNAPEEDEFVPDEEKIEFIETILHVMEDYINDNPRAITEPSFHDDFVENIAELMSIQLECIKEDLEDAIEEASYLFFSQFIPERSFCETRVIKKVNKDFITSQLLYLRGKPQPAQRTEEWYTFRHNLITASNAYKAFESDCVVNSLINEKCQPLEINTNKTDFVSVNTTFHWGQKYEPVSVMIYEENYGGKIGDFGCIQHDIYSFLGASPDGINIDPLSPTYGRMLEIKNIVNREIDGIPKKEYWVQMQMQMETCNLDECDFLETKFVEYDDYFQFKNDGTFSKSLNDERKGVILYFAKKNGNPHYIYCPLFMKEHEFADWEERTIDLYQGPEYDMIWIKNIYWKLEEISCVLVLRNQKWFKDNIHILQDIWKTIERERITGFAHRAPVKRIKKEFETNNTSSGCLINLNKESGKVIINGDGIIKVRTESFDDVKHNII